MIIETDKKRAKDKMEKMCDKLRQVAVTPESTVYMDIYRGTLQLFSLKKYNLVSAICEAVNKDL